jgi:cell division transport system permease protein
MKLVGASTIFIQLPFMLEGALAATVGALLAVGGLWLGVEYLVTDWLGASVGWIPYVSTADVLAVAPALVAVAILLAAISSLVTLSRYTKV